MRSILKFSWTHWTRTIFQNTAKLSIWWTWTSGLIQITFRNERIDRLPLRNDYANLHNQSSSTPADAFDPARPFFMWTHRNFSLDAFEPIAPGRSAPILPIIIMMNKDWQWDAAFALAYILRPVFLFFACLSDTGRCRPSIPKVPLFKS